MSQYTLMLVVSSSVCLVMLLAYWVGCLWRKFNTRNDDSCDEFGLPWVSTETPIPDFSKGGDMGRRIVGECGGPELELTSEWVIDKSKIVFECRTINGTLTKFYGYKRKKPSPYRYC